MDSRGSGHETDAVGAPATSCGVLPTGARDGGREGQGTDDIEKEMERLAGWKRSEASPKAGRSPGVHPAEHGAVYEKSEGERLTGWERSEASVSEAALLTWGPPMGRFFALFCLQVLLP